MKKLFLMFFAVLLLAACSKDDDAVSSQNVENDDSVFVSGLFSVSDTKQVIFSKGNLMYNAFTNTWCFADHQWDYIGSPSQKDMADPDYQIIGTMPGSDNAFIGDDDYKGWIDLFGWGTGDDPTKYIEDNTQYATFNDWGNNSRLKEDLGDGWYTLSSNEWKYIINDTIDIRKDKSGFATLKGKEVVGVVLLPDDWVLPDGCTFTAGYGDVWTTNSYDVKQWKKMEAAGAVFLPAAGVRRGKDLSQSSVGTYGSYWSSKPYHDTNALALGFCADLFKVGYIKSSCARSVRLVR